MIFGLFVMVAIFVIGVCLVVKAVAFIGMIATVLVIAASVGMLYISAAVGFATIMAVYHFSGAKSPALALSTGVIVAVLLFFVLIAAIVREIKNNALKFRARLKK
jgi:hypothetical protein